MNRRGFTIVELTIVIAIMGILLVLAVVNLRGTQANARDDERKADVEAIALNLEAFYSSGNGTGNAIGRYPSTGLIGNEQTTLRDIDPRSLATPGNTTSSVVATTNDTQTTAGVTPQPTINTYVYQPIQTSGVRCTGGAQECRKFNLYYKMETTGAVMMVMSKNQ